LTKQDKHGNENMTKNLNGIAKIMTENTIGQENTGKQPCQLTRCKKPNRKGWQDHGQPTAHSLPKLEQKDPNTPEEHPEHPTVTTWLDSHINGDQTKFGPG